MHSSEFGEPLILAVETSGRLGSVAIAQGGKLLDERQFSGPMRHSAEVFPAITDLLERFGKQPADIEQVYISIGPGSFTGLRIAVTLAKTLALANKAKIVAVDTLDIIAANVICQNQSERLGVILDAKRGQFFVAVYDGTRAGWEKIFQDSLLTAEEFLDRFARLDSLDGSRARRAGCGKPIALLGEGLVYYKDKFNDPAVRILDEKLWNPSAINVHRLGWELAKQDRFADPLTLTPNYIRGPDVTVKQS